MLLVVVRKKIQAYLLFITLIVPFVAAFLYIEISKEIVREEVRSNLQFDTDQLVKISFTSNQIEEIYWEASDEFEFHNKVYDVVKQEKNGDETIFWCWMDIEETELNNKLSQLLSFKLNNHQPINEQKEVFNQFIKNLFYQNNKELATLMIAENDLNFGYLEILKSTYIDTACPPPELS